MVDPRSRLDPVTTTLLVVDVQGTLSRLVRNHENLIETVKLMVKGADLFGIRTVVTEHVPEKLGPTHPEVAALFKDLVPITKDIFSCCGTRAFLEELKQNGTRTILLTGIETHICVYQTAVDLLDEDFRVELIADGMSARTKTDHKTGIERMIASGAGIMTAEMALYEMQGIARGDRFRQLIRLVKERDTFIKSRKLLESR